MKILVTGANGFIGKNLTCRFKEKGYEVLAYDKENTRNDLKSFLKDADFIVHLAGINRPIKEEEFLDGNVNFTKTLLDELKASGKKIPFFFSSSTQAERDNPYGRSKKMAEDQIFAYGRENDNPVYVYRLYNVYGKWCRPNYNSVIATWCYNITHDLPIEINENAPAIDFVYIDDIGDEVLSLIEGDKKGKTEICYVPVHDQKTLKEIASLLYSFKESRKNHEVPQIDNPFKAKLYATYLTYYEGSDYSYKLDSHADNRGSFTEILRTNGAGQFSVNIINPGITKGNHYHHTKNEKFLVVSGTCETCLRKIDSKDIISYKTSGDSLTVVDIPPGYTHSITNIGEGKAVVFMWASEAFDPNKPDTTFLPVLEK